MIGRARGHLCFSSPLLNDFSGVWTSSRAGFHYHRLDGSDVHLMPLRMKPLLPLWREPTFCGRQSISLFLLDNSRFADETKRPQPYPTQIVGSQWFD
jgi:hypothetical protein